MNTPIAFAHSLPLAHVLCFLRRAATLRSAARECRIAADKYPDTAASNNMRVWLELCASDGDDRAMAFERVVQVLQPFPKVSMLVLEFVESVMHPARSGEDLMAFVEHVEKVGVGGLSIAATTGLRREPKANYVPRFRSNRTHSLH